MSADAIANVESLNALTLSTTQTTGTVLAIITGGTIPTNVGSVRVTTAGAVTGVIMQPGTRAGQICTVLHEGAAANTITMAAVATSNVSNGVLCVITGPAQKVFVWDPLSATPAWFSNSTT
jgi:hypothetical protein